jgi:putative SOS response-associated peptidase YedK
VRWKLSRTVLRGGTIGNDGSLLDKRAGKEKLPFCFTLADEAVFAFAGIWDHWKDPQGKWIESCSILTTKPNELVQDIHDRMPVILARDAYDVWLDPGFHKVAELQPLLKPYPAEAMRRYRVSQRINQAANDDAVCAAEIDPAVSESRESGPLLY